MPTATLGFSLNPQYSMCLTVEFLSIVLRTGAPFILNTHVLPFKKLSYIIFLISFSTFFFCSSFWNFFEYCAWSFNFLLFLFIVSLLSGRIPQLYLLNFLLSLPYLLPCLELSAALFFGLWVFLYYCVLFILLRILQNFLKFSFPSIVSVYLKMLFLFVNFIWYIYLICVP